MSYRLSPVVLALAAVLVACGKPAPVVQPPAPAATPAPVASTVDEEAETRRLREAEAERRRVEEARVRAVLAERIHFDYDRADLRPDAREVLDRKLDALRTHAGFQLRIEGHADDRGSDEYNLALGMRRATATKQYLTGRGIAANRLEVMSHGEEQPLDRSKTESAWALNRRAEFVVMAGSVVATR